MLACGKPPSDVGLLACSARHINGEIAVRACCCRPIYLQAHLAALAIGEEGDVEGFLQVRRMAEVGFAVDA